MSEWTECLLEDVCEVVRGGSPRPIMDFITTSPEGINWVKIGDVAEGEKYFTHTKEKIIPEGASSSREVVVGDLILSNSMSFGRPYIMRISGCIHDGWLRLRNNEKLLRKEFLYYFLSSNIVQGQLDAIATGSVVNNLKSDAVKRIVISLPDIETQQTIAEILASLDDKIDLLSHQNTTLEALAQTYFRQWFVEGADESNGTLGEILIENEKSKIQVGEARNQSGDYPFFTSGVAILRYKDYLVDGRNIFLNTGGVADVKYLIGKAAYSTDTWSISADIFTDYVYLLLSGMVDEINLNYFMGTALQHLQKPQIRAMPIYIPREGEIFKFNEIVCPLFDKCESNKRQIYTLQKLRDTLLPKLISGEAIVKQ